MKRWSLMTALYIGVRYLGIVFSVVNILWNFPFYVTDVVRTVLYFIGLWMPVVVNAMLGVIMMTRIHAMYQRSKKNFIFLVTVFLASTIATGVMTGIGIGHASGEELILSGTHQCSFVLPAGDLRLIFETWIPTFIWEILALCLTVWIVTKHLCELRQSLAIGDCFVVLVKSHVLYFVAFAAVSCFYIGVLSPKIMYSTSTGTGIYYGVVQIAQLLQMFVLGPRLILSVRAYHAKLVSRSDEGIGMATIAFQERGKV
ncbi:hypothetical protein DFH29DRAFT_447699 [Suillus ampliporus]|nr:hypothetical protein DFH29DRAFT_447699 [Suillus ampliporus]